MLEQLRTAWYGLQPRQRIAVGTVAAVTLVGLAAVGLWSSRPTYSTLYGGLSPEEASAVVEELRASRVPYRLGPNASSILVPASRLYETRIALAGKGMPPRGAAGFELFDKSSLPGTDFSNNINLQRALQGELSRTISSIREVKSARVHLALPKESLYADKAPPTASVLLDLGTDGALRQDQVRGIAYLVASAVDGLSPRNVSIVDTLGNVLYGGGGTGTDLTDSTLASARAYSEALTARLQSMLDVMFGAHMTIVRAQAELDMDNEESTEERLEPVASKQTASIAREHTAEETYRGIGATTGGMAGVPSNLAGAGMVAAGERGGEYRSTEQTREYDFTRRKVTRKRLPGRITRLSVAAAVDESLAGQGADRVREVLQAAAGLDPARGDSIVVHTVKLKSAEIAAAEAKSAQQAQIAQQRQRTLDILLQRGLPLVVALVLLAVFARTVSEFRRAVVTPVPTELLAETPHEAEQPTVSTDEAEVMPAELMEQLCAETVAPRPDRRDAEEERELLEELRRIAREQPDLLADELRNLVSGQEEA